jgi:general secretion pathway protein G
MKQHIRQVASQRGFTLIEIMVVVIIIGILAAVIVPNLVGETDKARINAAKHDIQTLGSMLDRYKMDNFKYPSTDQGLDALVEKPSGQPEPKNYKQGGYIKKLPKDPWGNPYEYLNPGVHGQIDIFSKGADPNSPDDDIGNWNL